MRKVITIILLSITCFAQAQKVTLETLREIGLPVVIVETIDAEEPSCDYLTPEDGYPGYSIHNETKVPGRVLVIEGNDTIYDSGEYEKDISGMTIKLRGNNSAYTPKKPYKIKLQSRADMLGESDIFKDKNWVLLKDELPSLNLMIGLKINKLVGLQWTPRFRFVNVLFNGDYRGVYMLCESVERNTRCRLNVSNTGFIIEMDPYWWNEGFYFQSKVLGYKYTFKYPDYDDVDEDQLQYIIDYMSVMDNSLYGGYYDQYIDVESFASWVLGHDILGTYDASGSNLFFTKKDTLDSKLMMGNMWDFDTIERTLDTFSVIHNTFFAPLFKSKNELFVNTYIDHWQEISQTFLEDILAYLDDFANSELYTALETSRRLDFERWLTKGPTVMENIESNRQWFIQRKTYLDKAIQAIQATTAISRPSIQRHKPNGKKYDLKGIAIQDNCHKGLFIRDGHLFLSK